MYLQISGTPTLVQNTGHHALLLKDGYTGSFDDEASLHTLLRRLQTDVKLAQTIQAQGVALASKASPAEIALQYASMFSTILTQAGQNWTAMHAKELLRVHV